MNGKAFRGRAAKVQRPGKLWQNIQGVSGTPTPGLPAPTLQSHLSLHSLLLKMSAAGAYAESATGQKAKSLPSVLGARIMALFGDSITTDHISPAGSIKETSPAGQWSEHRVQKADFNSYGARAATTM